EDVGRLIERMDSLAAHAEETLAAAREQYVDGPRINRILNRLDNTTRVMNDNLEPMMRDTRLILEDGRKLTAFLSADPQIETYTALSNDTREVLGLAKTAARDATEIIGHVKAGKGTAGAL